MFIYINFFFYFSFWVCCCTSVCSVSSVLHLPVLRPSSCLQVAPERRACRVGSFSGAGAANTQLHPRLWPFMWDRKLSLSLEQCKTSCSKVLLSYLFFVSKSADWKGACLCFLVNTICSQFIWELDLVYIGNTMSLHGRGAKRQKRAEITLL